jgi:murein DD-endopeptidase MepM/ murein hydrolase activator NlpD
MAKFQCSYPVRPYKINQGFGPANTAPSALPTYKLLGLIAHNGLDLRAYHGQPIFAAHDGIAYWEVDSNQGEGVVIRTTEEFDYKGGLAYFKSIFWHLADPIKEPRFASPVYLYSKANNGAGMPVKRGDIIGYADNTGLSSGDHLHWGIKPIKASKTASPEDATDVGIGEFQNIEQLNGYMGAIDPAPYWDGFYADDPRDTELSPGDKIAVIAAQKEASGDTKLAQLLFSIAEFVRNFWNRNS